MAFSTYNPYGLLGSFPHRSSRRYWKPGDDFLQNTFHFPSFRYLPDENDVEMGYWEPDHYGVFRPACVWFFMGEIVNDETAQIPLFRNRVIVRDRNGGKCPISFYPNSYFGFDYRTLKNGSTILVTNGQKHNFLDLTVGLRVEYLDDVAVVPCSMNDFFQLSRLFHAKKHSECWSCGKQETSLSLAEPTSTSTEKNGTGSKKEDSTRPNEESAKRSDEGAAGSSEGLKRCAACRLATYCSKDCQKKDWKQGHKRGCKAVPIFRKLFEIDFRNPDDRPFFQVGIRTLF